MFDIDITDGNGAEPSGRATITVDDEGRARLLQRAAGAWGDEDRFVAALEYAGQCPDGSYRVRVPDDRTKEFAELIVDEHPELARKVTEARTPAATT